VKDKMSECIFCKIINKEIPSKIIDENDHVIVIEDIKPKTPIHYLIIPKIHVANINELKDTPEHDTIVLEMFKMIRKIAHNLHEPPAFNLVSNNGKQAGQLVLHMHWHFMSGKNIYSSGLKL
jgi:histidine triad (HIT) family protein